MKKIWIVMAAALLLAFCSACGETAVTEEEPPQGGGASQEEEIVTPSQTEEDTQAVEKIVLEGQNVTWDMFPFPTAETFALTGEDATLYDAMVTIYNPQSYAAVFSQSPYENTDLSLPAFDIYEKVTDEEGNTTYYGLFRQCDYYNVGSALTDLENPSYELHNGKSPASITLDAEGELLSFEQTYESTDDPEADIRRVCGPMEELADFFCGKNDTYPTEPHCIPGAQPDEMLITYLNYFFTTNP